MDKAENQHWMPVILRSSDGSAIKQESSCHKNSCMGSGTLPDNIVYKKKLYKFHDP